LVKVLLFVVASVALAYASRRSIGRHGSHGAYRLLAWECILGLLLLHVEVWFADPTSPRQLISWLLLMLSAVTVVWGAMALRAHGQPTHARSAADPALIAFEGTTVLVTTGIFARIRHPMYASLLLLAWGIALKRPTAPTVALAVVASTLLVLTARAEERENLEYFGPAYAQYMTSTTRFIPWLF
jgi:protein-S-isoprenylcysteine O-methyltransferase Ste14